MPPTTMRIAPIVLTSTPATEASTPQRRIEPSAISATLPNRPIRVSPPLIASRQLSVGAAPPPCAGVSIFGGTAPPGTSARGQCRVRPQQIQGGAHCEPVCPSRPWDLQQAKEAQVGAVAKPISAERRVERRSPTGGVDRCGTLNPHDRASRRRAPRARRPSTARRAGQVERTGGPRRRCPRPTGRAGGHSTASRTASGSYAGLSAAEFACSTRRPR